MLFEVNVPVLVKFRRIIRRTRKAAHRRHVVAEENGLRRERRHNIPRRRVVALLSAAFAIVLPAATPVARRGSRHAAQDAAASSEEGGGVGSRRHFRLRNRPFRRSRRIQVGSGRCVGGTRRGKGGARGSRPVLCPPRRTARPYSRLPQKAGTTKGVSVETACRTAPRHIGASGATGSQGGYGEDRRHEAVEHRGEQGASLA